LLLGDADAAARRIICAGVASRGMTNWLPLRALLLPLRHLETAAPVAMPAILLPTQESDSVPTRFEYPKKNHRRAEKI
jgi:hypothetical protein